MALFQLISSLTPANIAVLKTDISTKLNTVLANGKTLNQNLQESNFQEVADYYNTAASPQLDLWRPDLNPRDLNKFLVMTEFQALTLQKQNGWFAMIGGDEVDATSALVRTNFATIFGAGSATAINLTATAKKAATVFEKLFTTSNVSTMYKYVVSANDIESASR